MGVARRLVSSEDAMMTLGTAVVLSAALSLLLALTICFILCLFLVRLALTGWLRQSRRRRKQSISSSVSSMSSSSSSSPSPSSSSYSSQALASSFLGAKDESVAGRKEVDENFSVAFFHPYTNDGGGGERVLWCAVRAVQEEHPSARCLIYTGDESTWSSLKARASDRFGVHLPGPVEVVKLHRRRWVEASTFPRFTLIGQSLGSMVLGYEALMSFTPSIFVDTSGYAFTYPLAKIAGAQVAAYVHYPTISSDMLERVKQRRTMYNNEERIAKSWVLSFGKLLYYRYVALLYGLGGQCADVVMVNSRWTEAHIRRLWGNETVIHRVYPPCNTEDLQKLPLERSGPSRYLVSVAQFRPEKAHSLQLEAFAMALRKRRPADANDPAHSSSKSPHEDVDGVPNVRLQLIGSSRHAEDEERISKLRAQARKLGIHDRVDFLINIPYRELVKRLGDAIVGLHSMIDEHFGISVVEYMAAGAITIAHNSGGPRMDIVTPDEKGQRTGFLATVAEEYAEAIEKVLSMPEEERLEIAMAARQRAQLFSDTEFSKGFKSAVRPIFAVFEKKRQ
ncbi:hypothetical protein CBR_g12682 [Chara braunii]|uniref:GDP-Man:Man(3)GlcNAc(2)-PP-Dol alpha-1,2-mannosyltransferase n=1 Tax=Chara braunii TaxID=69332 RepID=A0A388KSQ1_CHABU|nr:hypothetical protein CBR_g12682 [Chara braunii]|eukprot:GBG72963.1 hypothetical protein CBR_g12682 [Chara braunii]